VGFCSWQHAALKNNSRGDTSFLCRVQRSELEEERVASQEDIASLKTGSENNYGLLYVASQSASLVFMLDWGAGIVFIVQLDMYSSTIHLLLLSLRRDYIRLDKLKADTIPSFQECIQSLENQVNVVVLLSGMDVSGTRDTTTLGTGSSH
jgi:hypothetical protein